MAISPAQQKYQDDLRKRGSAIGNFFTAPFKNIPNALSTIGSGFNALRQSRGDEMRASKNRVVQPSQSSITRSKLMGTSPLTTLGPQRPGSLPTSGGRPLSNTMGPVPRPPSTAPTGTPSATSPAPQRSAFVDRVSTNPSQSSGFQSTLATNDPAAIGGQMMNRTLGTQIPNQPKQEVLPPSAQNLRTELAPSSPQLPGAEAAYKDAYTQYIQSLAPGKDSQAARQKYLDFIQQRDLGLQEIADKRIPLRFVTGQQESVQKLAGIEANRLQGDVEMAQETESQLQQQARAGLEFQQEQLRREDAFRQAEAEGQKPIEVGGRLVNPRTGEVIYQGPAEAEKPMTLSPGETVFDPTTGRVLFTAPERPSDAGSGIPVIKDINGTSMQWDEASGQWVQPTGAMGAAAGSPETIEALQGKISMIDELMNHPGMAGSVGPYGIARFTPFSIDASERQDFAAGVNQLVSKETLDALLNLKAKGGTLGALSDPERLMLGQAATRIGSFMQRDKQGNPTGKFEVSEDLFKKELQTIRNLAAAALQRATGGGGGGGSGDELDQILDSLGFNPVGGVTNTAQLKELTIGKRTVRVAPSIALRLARAAKDFKQATGQDLQINQDFRSHEEQARLYKELSAKGARVAPPGQSFHEKGMAIDVTNWRQAEPFLRRYGLVNDLPDDRGHFSWQETNRRA